MSIYYCYSHGFVEVSLRDLPPKLVMMKGNCPLGEMVKLNTTRHSAVVDLCLYTTVILLTLLCRDRPA